MRELELRLNYSMNPPEDWAVTPLRLKDIRHIQTLRLGFASLGSTRGSRANDNLPRVIQTFAQAGALKRLEYFWLTLAYRPTPISDVSILLRALTNVKELHMTGISITSDGVSKPTRFPHLRTLELESNHDLEYFKIPNLSCIQCRTISSEISHFPKSLAMTLEYMVVPAYFVYRWNEYLKKSDPRAPLFPHVTHLRIRSASSAREPKVPLDMSNLQYLTFEERFDHPRTKGKSSFLNHFMLHILFSPELCPHLHTIRSTTYPNWTLATAMFYRRKSVTWTKPISSFYLPAYPQFNVLSLLTKALNARGDASTDAILRAAGIVEVLQKRLREPFFQGRVCHNCIISGYTVCSPCDLTRPQETSYDTCDYALFDIAHVRSSMSELGTFGREQWKEYLEETDIFSQENSGPTCERHDKQNLVHIGPHTIAR